MMTAASQKSNWGDCGPSDLVCVNGRVELKSELAFGPFSFRLRRGYECDHWYGSG